MTLLGIARMPSTPNDNMADDKVTEFWHFKQKTSIALKWNIVSPLCTSVGLAGPLCVEICALLGYYAASCGNCLPTLR